MAKFRLERVLRLRERVRELRQLEAGALGARRGALESLRQQADLDRERVLEEQGRAAVERPMGVEELRLGLVYAAALAATEARLAREVAEAEQALLAKREEVARERREERKLLRLEELHRERVEAREARHAELLLDELALHRRGRPGGEGQTRGS